MSERLALGDPLFWRRPLTDRMADFAAFRAESPFTHALSDNPLTGVPDEFYAVTTYAELVEISRHPLDYCSGKGSISIADMPIDAQEFFGSFITMDDPRHARQRVPAAMGRQRVRRLRPHPQPGQEHQKRQETHTLGHRAQAGGECAQRQQPLMLVGQEGAPIPLMDRLPGDRDPHETGQQPYAGRTPRYQPRSRPGGREQSARSGASRSQYHQKPHNRYRAFARAGARPIPN